MDLKQCIGPLMLDLEGFAVRTAELQKLRHPAVGGVILFARNYQSPKQVSELIQEIRAIRGSEFLIAVDQEGGRVQRFQAGLTRLPPACRYAEWYRTDSRLAASAAETAGWLMAVELLSIGIDFSFAPVLDVDCGISGIIGDRAFSQRSDVVSEIASAFRRGMNKAGMAAVGKHFPGHGGVALDSHLALPVDDRSFDTLMARDLIPFKRMIDEGLEGIMPAHVVYSQVDDRPAGFSEHWIRTVLREKLGFKGAIFSDDLSMAAAEIAGDYGERARQALEVGCDMVLVCNEPEAAEAMLDFLPSCWDRGRSERLLEMRGRCALKYSELLRSLQWRDAVAQIRELDGRL